MIINPDEQNLSPEEKSITDKLNEVDFSKIPTTEDFEKMKVKPRNRWFNSIMSLIVATTGVSLGVIIGLIIIHFA